MLDVAMADTTFAESRVKRTVDRAAENEADGPLLSSDQERELMIERITARIDSLIAEVAAWDPSRLTGQGRCPTAARYSEVACKKSQDQRS